jgi:hypothetical protein
VAIFNEEFGIRFGEYVYLYMKLMISGLQIDILVFLASTLELGRGIYRHPRCAAPL